MHDPCFKSQGGICLYLNKGVDYKCMGKVGYQEVKNEAEQFVRFEGIEF